MPSFFDSPHCTPHGRYCAVCRLQGESAHRAALLKRYGSDGIDTVDFDCPKGMPWGWQQPPAIPPGPLGVGAIFQSMLKRLRFKPCNGCACNKLARWMDRIGPDECFLNESVILESMRLNARECHYLWSAAVARIMLRYAIHRAKKLQ